MVYCFNCGKKIVRGKSFCHHCGAPIPDVPRLRPRSRAPEYLWRERRGLSLAIVAGCVLLLLLAGFGVERMMWQPTTATLARQSGNSRPPATTTTTAVAVGVDSTLLATAGTTSSSASSSTTAASITEATATPITQTAAAGKGVYQRTAEIMVTTLNQYDARIPHIGDVITRSAPNVPQEVLDELNVMVAELRSERGDLSRASAYAPAGFEVSKQWLDVAAAYMMYQAQYSLAGIEAMGETQSTLSAEAAFSKAQQAREGFLSAFATYQQIAAAHTSVGSAVSR